MQRDEEVWRLANKIIKGQALAGTTITKFHRLENPGIRTKFLGNYPYRFRSNNSRLRAQSRIVLR
jgi:hypothetical protein